MYALVSPETFLILLLYRLLLLCYYFGFVTGFFFILVQLTIQCNNSYHSEKRREIKFIILVDIAHL